MAVAGAGDDPRLFSQAGSHGETRSEVAIGGCATQSQWVAADSGQDQRVGGRVVVGEATGMVGRGREVQLPAQAGVNRQPWVHLPSVTRIAEHFSLTPGARLE